MGQKRLRALLTHFFTLSGKALTALPAPPKGGAFSHLPVSTNKAVRALYSLLNPESQRLFADTFTLACSPSQALTRQIPPFVAARHLPPARGKSSSGMGPLAWRESFRLKCKVPGRARGSLLEGAGKAVRLCLREFVPTPPVKMEYRSVRRRSGIPKL